MNHIFIMLFDIKTVDVPPKLISCSPSNTRSPLPLGNPTPIQGAMIWFLGTMTLTFKEICFLLKAGGSVCWLSTFHQFQYRFYSIWQAYFMVCGLRFREFPCFIKNEAFSGVLLCFVFRCFQKIWGRGDGV